MNVRELNTAEFLLEVLDELRRDTVYRQTMVALWDDLAETHEKMVEAEQELKRIQTRIKQLQNVVRCLGAIIND